MKKAPGGAFFHEIQLESEVNDLVVGCSGRFHYRLTQGGVGWTVLIIS